MHRHNLSNVNLENKTATCSVCGDVKIHVSNHAGKPIKCCMNKRRELARTNNARNYRKQWLNDNPNANSSYILKNKLKKLQEQFNLTDEQINHYLHSTHCEICGKERGKFRFALDHCHHTNRFRGVICRTCNSGIGMLQDSADVLEKALEYLKRFNGS